MSNEKLLTGKALKDRAATLNIKGRSSMNVTQLREAIAQAELNDSIWQSEIMDVEADFADSIDLIDSRQEKAEASMDAYDKIHGTNEFADVEQRLREHAAILDDLVETNSPALMQRVMDTLGLTHQSGNGRPLSESAREDNYRQQNNGGKVRSGKQSRRLKHKANKVNG